MNRRKFYFGIAIMLIIFVTFLVYRAVPHLISGALPSDFCSFYFAAIGFTRDGNIYDVTYLNHLATEVGFIGYVWPYLYPPPLAFYLSFLTPLGTPTITRLWVAFSLCLICVIVMLSRHFTLRLLSPTQVQPVGLLTFIALILCPILPFSGNIELGQVNFVVLACLIGALLLSHVYQRNFLAGFFLALAAVIKVTPLGFLLFFALERRYKAIYGCVVGLILLVVPTLLADGGIRQWQQFLEFSQHTTYGKNIPGLFPVASVSNFSIAGSMARLLPTVTTIQWATWFVLGLLGSILVWRHWLLRDKMSGVLLLGPYLIFMVIASPVAYSQHVIYLYPGLLLTLWHFVQKTDRRMVKRCLVILLLVAVASLNFTYIIYAQFGINWVLLQSLNLYALLALFVISLILAENVKTAMKDEIKIELSVIVNDDTFAEPLASQL